MVRRTYDHGLRKAPSPSQATLGTRPTRNWSRLPRIINFETFFPRLDPLCLLCTWASQNPKLEAAAMSGSLPSTNEVGPHRESHPSVGWILPSAQGYRTGSPNATNYRTLSSTSSNPQTTVFAETGKRIKARMADLEKRAGDATGSSTKILSQSSSSNKAYTSAHIRSPVKMTVFPRTHGLLVPLERTRRCHPAPHSQRPAQNSNTAPPYGSNPDVAYVLEPLVAASLRPRFHSYILVVLVTTTVLVTRTPLLP